MADKSIELSRYEHTLLNGSSSENRYGYFATKDRVLDLICTTPLVDPQITSTKFIVKDQSGSIIETRTSNSNYSVEVGAKVDIECKYKWVATSGKLPPSRVVSNAWTTSVPDSNTEVTYSLSNYTSKAPVTKSMTIQFTSPRTAPQVSGNALLRPSGDIVSSAQTRILSILYQVYHGKVTTTSPSADIIKELTKPGLNNTRALTVNGINTNTDNTYYCYAYPKDLGNLSNILMNGVDAILSLFNKIEVNIVNKYGLTITYNVYISANPGAFTSGTQLAFS
jgi:hypothetical protein